MGTLRRRTGTVPRHRAAGAGWTGALARHPWHAALAAAGAVALATGVMLLPGHSAPPPAQGCGLVTCTPRRATPAAAAAESGATLRRATQAPARARTAPAHLGGPAPRAMANPSPSRRTLHHGRAKGLAHRRCRPPRCR